MYKKSFFGIGVFVLFFLLCTKASFAASLNALSDTVTTSRPSASAPLGADQAAADGQITITDNNAVFLQGDVTTFWPDSGETQDTGITVASMSAANIPSSGKRIVFFTNTVTHTHHSGDAVTAAITAMHTISFKPVAVVPSGGKIVITFPALGASDTNAASPSAQTFQFNGLTSTNIQWNNATCSSVTVTGTSAGSTPTITCTTSASISSGTVVTVLIGCSANSGASCTTQVPTLINPMKSPTNSQSGADASTTTADNLKISVETQDTNSITLDSGHAVVGTIESVQVQANIDPTLTFQITGIPDATAINNSYVSGCPSSSPDTTNSGLSPTATFVNLGTVGTGVNIAGQKITVSTNGQGGYALTATASGQLNDAQNAYNINSSTTPGALTAGTELFGIHPCGTDVTNTSWNPSSTAVAVGGGAGGKVAWPTATTSLSLASRTSVANAIATAIEYAITANATTPAGLYTAIITYVATPTFN